MSGFMGKDGFVWFVGVVEDRQDPQKLGRVRVRCLGHHTEDNVKLPTADLPWAHPMNPITSATVSGVGQTPLGCLLYTSDGCRRVVRCSYRWSACH